MSFQKILVALDDSDQSKLVFARAIELAQCFKAALTLFSCISSELLSQPLSVPSDVSLYPDLTTSSYQAAQVDIITQQTERLRSLLESYSQAAQEQGLQVQVEVEVGDTGELICQSAKDWGADLIVLGRRGRTGLAEALLGSVSNHVLHHAPCSIFVIQGTSE